MLIQDVKQLEKYQTEYRIWQGIPSLDVTEKGRLFVTFYSGGTKEYFGNYCVLIKSDDGGKTWSDVIAAIYVGEEARAYDACLWTDPLGRLWWIWNQMPDNSAFAYICDHPDENKLHFGERITIGQDNEIQKPTVLSTGEWLFPVAVWDSTVHCVCRSERSDRKAFVYKTVDHGKTFHKLGGTAAEERHFDEHMTVERKDGSLAMYIRTRYGIAQSISYDGGETWTEPVDSGLGGPDSRFFIRRLRSGRLLLVNHKHFTGRNNLTAMLSDDDGVTWSEGLLLDERNEVSYPDGGEGEDGFIYIVYDRERGYFEKNLEGAQSKAREILMAKITEQDILAGKLVCFGSRLKVVINKLGIFKGDAEAMYCNYRENESEYIRMLADIEDSEEILSCVFRDYGRCCVGLDAEARRQLDEKCAILAESQNGGDICSRIVAIGHIISIFRSGQICADEEAFSAALIERIRDCVGKHISEPELGLDALAVSLNISKFYMCHIFKQRTGTTVSQYINYRRMSTAKQLLVQTDKSLTSVCMTVGFLDTGYFSKWFKKQEGVTPLTYRALNTKK